MGTIHQVWALQDKFHASKDHHEREKIRKAIRDLGFRGVAATIGYPSNEQRFRASQATSAD